MKLTGAQIIWECLVREGVHRRLRLPGRRDPARLRRDARLPDPPRPRAARAGRGAHGRRLRARERARSASPIATSGPGATNLVTGIATAMMDSSPIVCITGPGRQQAHRLGRLPGDRHHRRHAADHEAQLPGDARARTSRRRSARRSTSRASGRPGPVLVDITKDAQQATCDVRLGRAPRRSCPATGPIAARAERATSSAARADRRAPSGRSSSPGHGVMLVGRDASSCGSSPSSTDIPVAMTLLGLGGFPAIAPAQPRHDGHARRGVGQHGDPGGRPAARPRHALRRPRHRQPARPTRRNAKKIHVEIDPAEINKNVQGRRRRSSATCARCSRRCCRGVQARRSRGVARAHRRAARATRAVRDIQNLPDDGHLYAAHVIHDLWRDTERRRDRRHRRRPAPDVGGAVLQARRRRARSSPRAASARWASRCRRRSAPRSRGPTPRSGSSSATAASR